MQNGTNLGMVGKIECSKIAFDLLCNYYLTGFIEVFGKGGRDAIIFKSINLFFLSAVIGALFFFIVLEHWLPELLVSIYYLYRLIYQKISK